MPTAYVFIRLKLGTSDYIYGALKQIPSVQEVFLVYGKHDILVKLATGTMAELKHLVIHTSRQLDNICATQTMVVIE